MPTKKRRETEPPRSPDDKKRDDGCDDRPVKPLETSVPEGKDHLRRRSEWFRQRTEK